MSHSLDYCLRHVISWEEFSSRPLVATRSTYHPMVDFLWRINVYSFTGCIIIPSGCISDSIGMIDIVDLTTYEKVVVLHINMFGPWLHGRIPSQCQGPTIIFKHFLQYSWRSDTNIIHQDLHLCLTKLVNEPPINERSMQDGTLRKNIICRMRVLRTYIIWCQLKH